MVAKILIIIGLLLVASGLLALAIYLFRSAIKHGFWKTETITYEATLEVKLGD